MRIEERFQQEQFNHLCVFNAGKAIKQDEDAFVKFMINNTNLTKRELNGLIKTIKL